MLDINIYTSNEGSKVKFSKIFVGAKSVFLKSVGAAAPTLTKLLSDDLPHFHLPGEAKKNPHSVYFIVAHNSLPTTQE